MSLDAFGVKNLRCLVDTGLVPIRPITVLVGRNSSGKSTFLRAFPLLRQSVEEARNSPILWFREGYIDFGSLQDAANNRSSEPSVTFRFLLRLPEGAHVALGDPLFDIAMTLAGGETPHVSAYEIRVEDHHVRWDFDALGRAQGLTVNERAMRLEGALSLGGKAYLVPTLQPGDTSSVSYQAAPEVFQLDPVDYHTRADDVLATPLADALTRLLRGHTAKSMLGDLTNAYMLRVGQRSAMRDELLTLVQRYQRDTNELEAGSGALEEIASLTVARLSPLIIEAADQVLARYMSRVSYVAPLRVSAQRAHRVQNLAVEEVDPDGNNLAMFLRSLSPAEAESFAAFTRDALGFETAVKTTGIYAEILVKGGGSKRFVNLVDVGFGYSEVLPLAAVLWASCIRPTLLQREPAPLVAIEQPELHLHPAHQAKLARMLVEAMRISGGAKILVETHSESLINGLGKLVYEGVIRAEDIQIALFDQDEETEQTTVRLAGYRENGALHDWPYGFLSPVAGRRVPPAAAE